MARPTKYDEDMLQAAWSYLEHHKEAGDPVPTVAGLACELNVAKSTVYDWASQPEKSAFSDVLTRIEVLQERKLVSGGLDGDFNPAITKMMLTKHGYSDKIEQAHTSPDGSMSPPSAFIIEGVAPDDDSTSD